MGRAFSGSVSKRHGSGTLGTNPVFVSLGVIDFDAETGDDPQQHGEYAFQTFQYYKVRLYIILFAWKPIYLFNL